MLIPVTNAQIRLFQTIQTNKGRQETGLYLLEGARLIRDGMRYSTAMPYLLIRKDMVDAYRDVIQYVQLSGGEVWLGDERALERSCHTKTPQGICAAALLPKPADRMGKFVLALDHVKDPGNMGTILRTAEAFGVEGAILSRGCCDPFSPKCVRSAMGALFGVSVFQTEDLPKELQDMKINRGYTVVGGHLNGYETLPELGQKRVCVIGGEANGMEEETALVCSALYRIPMRGRAESLNAGVAAGILMFQLFGS